MRTWLINVVLSVVVVALLGGLAVADITEIISYQGRLLDSGGDPVADGNYVVTFEIFDSSIPGGSPLWSSGNRTIVAAVGLFNYPLGDSTAIPDDIFQNNAELWLEVTVVGDPPMSPRTQLTASGYAFHALRADNAPGVTQSFVNGDAIITGFLNPEGLDSINCPTDGYVMVNVTLGINCSHTAGDDDVVFILITDSTTTVPNDQDGHPWALPTGAGSGLYSTMIHSHRVFPVSAGWNKFQVLSFQNPGGGTDNFASSDAVMTLLFIPENYGTVNAKTAGTASSKFDGVPLKQE